MSVSLLLTKPGRIFTVCSSILDKANGPELYKCSMGNIISAEVQIISVSAVQSVRQGRVTAYKPVEIISSLGKFLSPSHGPRVVQSNPSASGDSRAAQGLGGVLYFKEL